MEKEDATALADLLAFADAAESVCGSLKVKVMEPWHPIFFLKSEFEHWRRQALDVCVCGGLQVVHTHVQTNNNDNTY